ncbi:unnamed protein product [Euphydryas editha]|uniref:Pentatricopeptide repeat-containing protein 2, mitochondrial n=1 Tax=Euphydryas editha TaxID=104508 RepID=A0AAU9TYF3_EUPED|nr:unnamed protein product [Euphydryas editha]
MLRIREPCKCFRLLFHFQKLIQGTSSFTTTIDGFDLFYNEPLQKYKPKDKAFFKNDYNLRYFMGMDINTKIDVDKLSVEEIENTLQDFLSKNKDKQMIKIISDCLDKRKLIRDDLLKQMLRHYSLLGKVDAVEFLRKYCHALNPALYKRNGEFLHYLAKAQCMKGNSEKGLSVLKEAYTKYTGLRSFYRVIFSELIHDSIQNRSEASIVIFKKYVLEFSNIWHDHYPLICFWHICWSSSWFSDQTISYDLLDTCVVLQDIIKDKATTFSINILREYNEDAVIRLLQILLKYKMMEEYVNVLQILFSYKLKNRDLRGCTEIIKNCQTLGISLPSYQQGRYIKMLINTSQTQDKPDEKQKRLESKNFKLKF